jgi:hypothetical protein
MLFTWPPGDLSVLHLLDLFHCTLCGPEGMESSMFSSLQQQTVQCFGSTECSVFRSMLPRDTMSNHSDRPQNSKLPSKARPSLFSPMWSKMNYSDGATGVVGIPVGTDPSASGIRRREFIPAHPERKEGSKRRRRNKRRERSHSCSPSCNHDHVEDVQHFATLNEYSAGRCF